MLPVDPKIIVSRKAWKNNTSKYFINGKDSTFTEVTTLLKQRDIDLDHKRFLILQGEVESIAQMKPKAQSDSDDGLLEYLEDIIGTSKYKIPISDAAQELEGLNETCSEKTARVKHVENERDALVESKDAVLQYLQDEESLIRKQSALYQLYIKDCKDNLEITTSAIDSVKIELATESKKSKGNENDLKAFELEIRQLRESKKTVDDEVSKLSKQLSKLGCDDVQLKEKQKHLTSKQKKIVKQLQTTKRARNEAAAWIENYETETAKFDKEIESMQENLKQEDRSLQDIQLRLRGKTQDLSDGIEEKQKLLQPWLDELNTLKSKNAVLDSERQILLDKQDSTSKLLEVAQKRLVDLQQESVEKVSTARSVSDIRMQSWQQHRI